MGITLYQLSEHYGNALQELLSNDDIPEEAIFDTQEALQGEIKLKAQNVAAVFLNIEAECDAIENAVRRMQERLKSRKAKKDWLKMELQHAMVACGISEISCPEFSLKLQNNPPAVKVEDELLIPVDYMVKKVKIKPDLKKIKEAINAGEQVPGAHLEQSQRLVIK